MWKPKFPFCVSFSHMMSVAKIGLGWVETIKCLRFVDVSNTIIYIFFFYHKNKMCHIISLYYLNSKDKICLCNTKDLLYVLLRNLFRNSILLLLCTCFKISNNICKYFLPHKTIIKKSFSYYDMYPATEYKNKSTVYTYRCLYSVPVSKIFVWNRIMRFVIQLVECSLPWLYSRYELRSFISILHISAVYA